MNGIPTRILGRGRYGVVVQVHNPLLDRSYALKVIALDGAEEQTEKAMNECRLLSQLEHPNIIRSYGCWLETSLHSLDGLDLSCFEEGLGKESLTTVNWTSCSGLDENHSVQTPTRYLFLQMELCDGTLADWIEATSAGDRVVGSTVCRAGRYLNLFHQLCKGLQYLHDANYIHNDLKPANVCLLKGTVKLTDFGLSSTPFSSAGVGTPLYSAPEVFRSPASDVFSLGLIFYELATCGQRLAAEERRRLVREMRETGKAPADHPPAEHGAVMESMVAPNALDRPSVALVIHAIFPDEAMPPSPLTPIDPSTAAAGSWAAFLDMLLDAAVLANSGGIVVAMNDTACELFGYERSELLGHSVNQLMPRPYARVHDNHLRRYLKEGGPKRLIGRPRPLPICRKDGRTQTVEVCLGELEQDGEHYFLACFRAPTDVALATSAVPAPAKASSCPFRSVH